MTDYVIQTDRLTRYFGSKCAVDQVSLRIPRGCIAALLGRNGSGKTTLMRMLLGLLEPTRGSSTILGHSSLAIPPEIRGRIGYVAEGHPLYSWMTIQQLAEHQSAFYATWNSAIYHSIIDHFQLSETARAGSLSRGQRAGVALALALAPEPELLVLDDPSLGLDPVARRAILEVIINVCGGGNHTVFLSTHELQDVERIADRVLVLDQSVLVADAEKDHFLSHVQEFVLERHNDEPLRPKIAGLVSSRREGKLLRLIVANPDETTHRAIAAAGGVPVEQRDVSLEDAVIAYLARRGSVLVEAAGGKGGAA
jgi:ABC-2 type transport system ATP-binding protein